MKGEVVEFLEEEVPLMYLFLIVSVPKEDPFGVREFVEQTSVGTGESEVMFSHDLVGYLPPMTNDEIRCLLRSQTPISSEAFKTLQRLANESAKMGEEDSKSLPP